MSNYSSAVSTLEETSAAVDAVCAEAKLSIAGKVDVAFVFFSHHHVDQAEEMAVQFSKLLETDVILGCTGESIVSCETEHEGTPAISLWVANLPGVDVCPMHLQLEQTPDGPIIVGWPESIEQDWPEGATLLTLGEPFTFPMDAMLQQINEEHPQVPIIGGMASGGQTPGANRLLLGDQVCSEGAVAVMLHGPLRIQSVVSQGCRPIGRPFVITKADRNIIYQLGGQPAVLQLKEVFDSLTEEEQMMVQQGLHIGQVVSEYQDEFKQGDFLIRNVMGLNGDDGSIAVGDFVRVGQTVQFQIRDERSADDELRQLLRDSAQHGEDSPAAGLLFSCNGRGTRLFTEPNHDAAAVAEFLGRVPLAGFFAQGEIGPVGGKNFMHGFTACLALFY